MEIIRHGIPQNNKRVYLLPVSYVESNFTSTDPSFIRPLQKFQDPKTDEIYYGRIYHVSTCSIEELESGVFLPFAAYGLTPQQASYALQIKYPEIKETQRFRAVCVEIVQEHELELTD